MLRQTQVNIRMNTSKIQIEFASNAFLLHLFKMRAINVGNGVLQHVPGWETGAINHSRGAEERCGDADEFNRGGGGACKA
jgi:hypothetical protein